VITSGEVVLGAVPLGVAPLCSLLGAAAAEAEEAPAVFFFFLFFLFRFSWS
jgi:hypothetical protein